MSYYKLVPKITIDPDCFMCEFSENDKDNTCRRPVDLPPCGSDSIYLKFDDPEKARKIIDQVKGSGLCQGCLFFQELKCTKPRGLDPCDQHNIYAYV